MTPFYFHVGYPKTATTTLQANLFPSHSQIDYLGKYIPAYGFRDARLLPLIESLTSSGELFWENGDLLSNIFIKYQYANTKPAVLLSTENFLHVSAVDIGIVAARLKSVVPNARIIITIRSQIDLLRSFFWNHGKYGQYLYVVKDLDRPIRLPLSMSEWLEYQFRAEAKNMLPTLLFDKVVSCYWRLFGRENVCLLMQEEFFHQPEQFVRKLANFMDINAEEAMALTDGKWENVKLSNEEAQFLQLKLRFGCRKNPNPVVSASLKWVAKLAATNRSNVTIIDEPWLSKLISLFGDSNRRLEVLTGLPLRRLGYP